MKDSCIMDINPMIVSSETKHFLVIYHDIGLEFNESNARIVRTISPGHFYIGLKNNQENISYGFYPANLRSAVMGKGVIKCETQRLDLAARYKEESSEDVLCTRLIPLTHVQYSDVLDYIQQAVGEEQRYIIGQRDCADFVQDVYHRTGLSLYFTKVFKKAELIKLDTPAACKVLERYGSKDTFREHFQMIKRGSIEELASELNLPESQIVEITWRVSLIAFPDTRESLDRYFTVTLNDSDIEGFSDDENSTNATELAALMGSLGLSEERVKQSHHEMQDFFSNMSSATSPEILDFLPSMEDLHPQTTPEMQEGLADLLSANEQIFVDFGLGGGNSFVSQGLQGFGQNMFGLSSQMMGCVISEERDSGEGIFIEEVD